MFLKISVAPPQLPVPPTPAWGLPVYDGAACDQPGHNFQTVSNLRDPPLLRGEMSKRRSLHGRKPGDERLLSGTRWGSGHKRRWRGSRRRRRWWWCIYFSWDFTVWNRRNTTFLHSDRWIAWNAQRGADLAGAGLAWMLFCCVCCAELKSCQ